ncbi:MAG: hypothetical protein KKA05_00825, partial [Alphaproteobacteria bacterium]|nr:hypothetical protein [Alphaproteobacteria bacterium]
MAQDQTTRQPILGETGYRLLGLTKDWGRYGAARAWHFIAAAPDAPFVAPEPTRHKPRPRPAAAPTGMNSAPTLLAAMASCYNITEQDEILQKLANALNDFKITALPGGKNTAVFMATTAMTVAIDNAHVLTEKEVLTPDDAHKLALLALANPAMRANGLSVSGNAADRYILQRAAESLGLKVLNPVTDATPEIRAAIDKEWDSYVIATPAPDKDKKTSPRDDLNKAARPTKPEPDTSPIAPAIAEMLKAGKVEED